MDEIRKKAQEEAKNIYQRSYYSTPKLICEIRGSLEPLYRRIDKLEKGINESHGSLVIHQKTWGACIAKEREQQEKITGLEVKLAKAVEALKGEIQINYEFCYHEGSCGAEINNCYAQHIYKALKEIEGGG